MRGSVWVELEIWIVAYNRGRYRGSSGTNYGFSATTDLNSKYQREQAYQNAVIVALKHYRNEHHIDSDTEINYHLIGSGINTTTKEKGYTSDKWKSVRITPQKKREIHRLVGLGKDKPLTKIQLKQDDKTLKEYNGEKMKLESNEYIVKTKLVNRKRTRETCKPPIDTTLKPLRIVDKRTRKQKNKNR